MSLTSFLKSPVSKKFREKLRKDFPRPKILLQGEMIAPPQSKNYGIVGTAFDYLLRFKLEREYLNTKELEEDWVADLVMKKIAEPKPFKLHTIEELDELYDGELSREMLEIKLALEKKWIEEKLQARKNFSSKVGNLYEEAKSNYRVFMESGKFTKELAKSAIVLAKLDLVSRAGIYDETISISNDNDIHDLENLFKAIPLEKFKPSNEIILNPTFGTGSAVFLGADADLIIDNTLIEIKTTKKLEFTRNYINQLLSYTLASRIGGINRNENSEDQIQNIGVYFSRHGLLCTIPLASFGTNQKFEDFKNWVPTFFEDVFTV